MKFLIFGSSGFIGTHLAKYLAAINPDADILKYDIKERVSNDFELLDVRHPINITYPDTDTSIIFNLAAVHVTPGHPDNEYFETNIWGAENVCNFARKNGINTIVFTSSIAPYGPSEDLKKEETLPMPNTPYGISKLTAEYIHKVWQAEDPENRKLIIVRPGVVFGKSEGGNFTRLYSSIKKGIFFYPGRKDTIKACIYVKDMVRILYQSAIEEPSGAVTYNLTYYPSPSIEEICETIAKVTDIKPPSILMPAYLLKNMAGVAYYTGRAVGRKLNGIHPARVKKLMISTNISGENLFKSPYKLQYTLEDAIRNWYNDCDNKGLL